MSSRMKVSLFRLSCIFVPVFITVWKICYIVLLFITKLPTVISITHQSPPRNTATRSTISFPTADSFVKREDELAILRSQLREPLQCHRAALCGLGGVGYVERLALST